MLEIPTLSTAATAAQVYEAAARFCWHTTHPGEDCPEIPTETDLANWLRYAPDEAKTQTAARLAEVFADEIKAADFHGLDPQRYCWEWWVFARPTQPLPTGDDPKSGKRS